ncbi:unnamed protein product [Peniophora sp. CBMAI 1063]|nr:unnamed protein product [Peniophora sp. CBMAI 1063]
MSTVNERSILDYEPVALAEQLTLIEWALFSKIEPKDVIDVGRDPQSRAGKNDTISDMIQSSNKIAHWVVGAVLEHESVEKRASVLERFISITESCRTSSNLSTMVALVSGLNSPPVDRLKKTWALVGQESKDALGRCRTMIDPLTFGKYQEVLRGVEPPCVPFIGAYLMLVRQPPSETRPSDEEIVQEVRKWQGTPYKVEGDEEVEKFLRGQLEKYDGQSGRGDNDYSDVSRRLEQE